MTPTNSSYNKDTCVSTSSNCVTWDGPDLPCIQLCKGDSISDTVFKLAKSYCEFKDTIDLTDFDLKCLFVACEACPEPDKAFRNVLCLIRDRICDLEEAIANLNPTNVIIPDPFDVNLKCLAVTDGSGNILNDTTQSEQVQAIIDQTCTNKTDIGLLQNEVDDHEVRITTLENNSSTDLPSVTSDCVFIGSKPLDQAYNLLDSDYCELKTSIGSSDEINGAIGQQCNLPALIGNPAFITSPGNLAESFGNVWLALCNALSRIQEIESNCCAPTCDSIKLGFSTAFNEDTTVTLTFNAGTGTTIPNGWTDCGSILTISDTSGNSITILLTLVNNYTSPDIDLTSFTKGTQLTFSLDAKLCSDALSCQKCITKTVLYSGSDCCTYTNNSGGDITLIYQTPATPITSNN